MKKITVTLKADSVTWRRFSVKLISQYCVWTLKYINHWDHWDSEMYLGLCRNDFRIHSTAIYIYTLEAMQMKCLCNIENNDGVHWYDFHGKFTSKRINQPIFYQCFLLLQCFSVFYERSVFRAQSNIYDEAFCENS